MGKIDAGGIGGGAGTFVDLAHVVRGKDYRGRGRGASRCDRGQDGLAGLEASPRDWPASAGRVASWGAEFGAKVAEEIS